MTIKVLNIKSQLLVLKMFILIYRIYDNRPISLKITQKHYKTLTGQKNQYT